MPKSENNSTKMPEKTNSAEAHLAKHLASNDPLIRKRAMKKIKPWLIAKSVNKKMITYTEFMMIWKGLHYCMWMSDKPLTQEDLADEISELIHCFSDPKQVCLFVDTFFQTLAREWYGIDRFRLEKFMMLIRRFVLETFRWLGRNIWEIKLIKMMNESWGHTFLNPAKDICPSGLKLHVFDLFMDELANAGGYEMTAKQFRAFLKPFAQFIALSEEPTERWVIIDDVFRALLYHLQTTNKVKPSKKNPMRHQFDVDLKILVGLMKELASCVNLKQKNRECLYRLASQYEDMSVGVFPLDRINTDDGKRFVLTDKDIEKAALKLLKRKGKDSTNRRKRFAR